MAELPYATATSANDDTDDNNEEENDTCAYQDDGGALADSPSPGDCGTSSSQVRQQATPRHAAAQGGTAGAGDVPRHPIWHPRRAGRLPDIAEEGMDEQARMAVTTSEVEEGDTVIVEPHYLCSWDSYSPHNHSEGDALFDKADQTMD